MRIRKRLKPELHESSNGGLHLHATSKSNPSFQDPSPAGTIKQDHFLLAGSAGSTHRPSQQQLPAEAVPLQRKRPTIVSPGPESCEDDKGLMMKKGERNPRAKDVQHINEVKHLHIHIDGDDNVKDIHIKGCKELQGLLGTSCEEGDTLSDACKKVRHNIVCKGSALHEEIGMHADPAMVDASECPRKVRPLQLILRSDYSPTSAPKLPLPFCPTRSSTTMPATPPPLPRKFDKASPSALMKMPSLTSPAGGSLIIKQIADDVKPRDETSRRDAISSDQSLASHVENGAEFDSCRLVSSWQGLRRPRSHVKGGCGRPAAPGVNAQESTDQTRKKTKRKPVDILFSARLSSHAPPSTPAGNGELRNQDFPAAGYLVSPHDQAKPPANYALTRTYDEHIPPVFPAASSDHELLQLDSMRCRRKDGRRWRCKAQVVKAGAPFCHYHTLKMREKHAASVARKLSKQLQGEVKISLSDADFSRSSNKRANKRRRLRSSPSVRRGCTVDEYEGDEEEEHEDELEEEEEDQQQKMLAEKLQESAMSRRRWRKKCKPCIRRLHDIHDRARPGATDGLDLFKPDTSNIYQGPPPRSSLPECLLNTDPYEWRSDFP